MGLFSSSEPIRPIRTGTGGASARPAEDVRFATSPLALPIDLGGGGGGARATANRFTTGVFSASASSRPLAPDAPTPAVPLASLLEEARGDDSSRWGLGATASGDSKTSQQATGQELSLYRLAIDANNLNYEQAFTILALTVEFFHRGEHVERVEQMALRTAAGVLLRIQKHIKDGPARILAPYYVEQLRNIFQAWHLYRELLKAIDNRSDFFVRMRGKADPLIVDSLFSEEGRSMLAARVEGVIEACGRLQLDSESIKRAEWIGKLIMYRTEDGQWQVPPDACLGLCTRLVREINDETVMGEMRKLAVASWEGLCKESNFLRDVFAEGTDEERARGVILIRTSVPVVGLPVTEEEPVLYFPDHNSFRGFNRERDKQEREQRERDRYAIRLVV